jgi:hypothetical protein
MGTTFLLPTINYDVQPALRSHEVPVRPSCSSRHSYSPCTGSAHYQYTVSLPLYLVFCHPNYFFLKAPTSSFVSPSFSPGVEELVRPYTFCQSSPLTISDSSVLRGMYLRLDFT